MGKGYRKYVPPGLILKNKIFRPERLFVNFNWFSDRMSDNFPNAIIETNSIKHICIVFCEVRTKDTDLIQISLSLYIVKMSGDHKPN
jgi:hypothetical protein